MKVCKKCGEEKELTEFYIYVNKNNYVVNKCKECSSADRKSNYIEKIDKYRAENKYQYQKRIEFHRERSKIYKREHKNLNSIRNIIKGLSENIKNNEKVCSKCFEIKDKENFTHDKSKKDDLSSPHCNKCKSKYANNRKKIDPLYKLKTYIRSSISESITKMKFVKKLNTQDIIGCSFLELKIYIENKFTEGMSWENYGVWHIDHKIPLSWAKKEEEIYNLNHYTNLQPMWGNENIKKGNRYASL